MPDAYGICVLFVIAIASESVHVTLAAWGDNFTVEFVAFLGGLTVISATIIIVKGVHIVTPLF